VVIFKGVLILRFF